MRITKDPEERKREIIQTAKKLFEEHGYEKTKIIDITRSIDIAKGTFYHYFQSKHDILKEIVDDTLTSILNKAEELKNDASLNAIEKLRKLLLGGTLKPEDNFFDDQGQEAPLNRELQEQLTVEVVLRLTPIFTQIIQQGIKEGLCHTDHIKERTEFILSGSQFLLDSGLFVFTEEEKQIRQLVLIKMIEESYGLEEGILLKT